MFARRLQVPHRFVCVTDDARELDTRVTPVRLPDLLRDSPRCIRRLRQYDGDWAEESLGARFLSVDLDMVLTDDVTPLFDRPEPIVCWKVGYARVYTGALVLMDSGALHGLWRLFSADPEGYAREAQRAIYGRERAGVPWGGASDQPVLNHYIRSHKATVAELRDEDGITTYFSGYRPKDPPMAELRPGVRLVSFGSANKKVIESGRHQWIRECWR
jgi:hypothetical protein